VSWLEIVAFLALGVGAGAYGTLVGIGGGLIVVPVLILSQYPYRLAVGTSLVVVLANAVSGSTSFLQQRVVNVRAGLVFALCGIPGALLGAAIDQHVPLKLFNLLFAVLLVVVGLRILLTRVTDDAGDFRAPTSSGSHYNVTPTVLFGFLAGFIASIFGVGGGILYVPTMVYLMGFVTHVATATSTFIIAMTAIFGTLSHAHFHDIRWGPAIAISCGALIGGQIGARTAPRVKSQRLLQYFSIAIFVAAAWLVYRSL
jgi:uncharacterized protein